MCTSANHPQILHRSSSNGETIDRLIQALLCEPRPSADNTTTATSIRYQDAQDPLASLTSSLQSAYLNFGIFDSLSLKRKSREEVARPSESNESQDQVEGMNILEQELLDEVLEVDFDAAWREFDPTSWQTCSMPSNETTPAPMVRQRSGRRRGYQGRSSDSSNADTTTTETAQFQVMMIPTKTDDGPSFSSVGAAINRFSRDASSSPNQHSASAA